MKTILAAAILLSTLVSVKKVNAQTIIYKPKDQQLYNTIAHMDSVMFNAFNQRNVEALKKVFADNLEFYNDGGGLTDYQTTINNFDAMFKRNTTTGLRRELVNGSLEVYPMPGFGAVEVATNRFIHTENGKEEVGLMKFIQIWQNKGGEWKVTRVISLDH